MARRGADQGRNGQGATADDLQAAGAPLPPGGSGAPAAPVPVGGSGASAGEGSEPERFGDLLREFRTARGLSQSAVAARAGVDRSYVNRLEAGDRGAPAQGAAGALIDALELSDSEADRLLAAADLLPRSLRRLGVADPTLLRLAQRLTDPTLSAASRTALRRTVETILRHWSDGPAEPSDSPGLAQEIREADANVGASTARRGEVAGDR